jgi:hypothetical protein
MVAPMIPRGRTLKKVCKNCAAGDWRCTRGLGGGLFVLSFGVLEWSDGQAIAKGGSKGCADLGFENQATFADKTFTSLQVV